MVYNDYRITKGLHDGARVWRMAAAAAAAAGGDGGDADGACLFH